MQTGIEILVGRKMRAVRLALYGLLERMDDDQQQDVLSVISEVDYCLEALAAPEVPRPSLHLLDLGDNQ